MTEEFTEDFSIDITEDLWWVFYLKMVQTIETLQPLLNDLTKAGFRIVDTYVSAPYFRLVLREEEGDMVFQLSNPSDDVAPFLFLGTLADQFIPPSSLEVRSRADRFLEYGKICYWALRPLYAFAENLNTYIEMDDILAHRLTHICWAQFFGPGFVQGFGQAILTNAPAWRNENLGDGGILYAMAASPYLYRGSRQFWQQAKDYFAQHSSMPIHWSSSPGSRR